MNVCQDNSTNRRIIMPQCSHSRRSFLRTTHPLQLCRPMMIKPGVTYCPLPHESSHHAKLMEPFGDTLSFLTYFDNQSIKECPTATGDEARAVLLNVQGDIGHYPEHVEQIVRKEFQKWASPFLFASTTVST